MHVFTNMTISIHVFVSSVCSEKEADMNRRYEELNQELRTLVSIEGMCPFYVATLLVGHLPFGSPHFGQHWNWISLGPVLSGVHSIDSV